MDTWPYGSAQQQINQRGERTGSAQEFAFLWLPTSAVRSNIP